MSKDIVILDYETELMGDHGDPWPRVLEVGCLRVSSDLSTEIDAFASLVNPGRRVEPRHKAKLENVDRTAIYSARRWDGVCGQVARICRGAEVWAWPASFEEAVTRCECVRSRIDMPFRGRIRCLMTLINFMADTQGIEHGRGGGSDALLKAYGVERVQPEHRSLSDCRTFWDLWYEATVQFEEVIGA
jgi:DNA polymerase III epsilon subunit-like protein